MQTKRIILCADDYGQNEAISQGIVELIKLKRISAVSCLTTAINWPQLSQQLRPLHDQVAIGLHLNLTEQPTFNPEAYCSLPKLIIKANLRKLDPTIIEQEFSQQLTNFIEQIGQPPDFIDGHQHIHQLPIICDILLKLCHERLTNRPFIRYVHNKINIHNLLRSPKNLIINLISDGKFGQKLRTNQIPHNESFAGIYNFANAKEYAKLFPQFLAAISDNGLIMCHPGLASTDTNDKIALARKEEMDYFLSSKFIADCAEANIKLASPRGLEPLLPP